MACGGDGVIELVALVPYRQEPLSLSDLPSDRARFEELRDGQFDRWRSLTTAQLEDAGQQELLNWVCLAGAMCELGRRPVWTDLAETYIYAAPKAFAIFDVG